MIGVSACLAGFNCTYAGKNNLHPLVKKLVDEGKAIVVCPEVLGGLSIPRTPCEIINNRVIDRLGNDRTLEYLTGARKALVICLENKVDLVLLKSRSPSCGKGKIYDGTFSHVLTAGNGIFVKLLQQTDIKVYNEDEIENILKMIGE